MDGHERMKRAGRRARIVGRRHALARVAAAVVGAVVFHAKPFDAALQRGRAAASHAAYIEQKLVSPPLGGTSSA